MSAFEKIKLWFTKNKKYIKLGGTVLVLVLGSAAYIINKNNNLSEDELIKIASKEELRNAYDEMVPIFQKTGKKPLLMEKIGKELGVRGAAEWFEKHPPNTDPNFRWTDANRWE